MKITNGKKGITLVALVITIIILLILAGVAIAGLGGENGLISKVNKAKEEHIRAEMKEKLSLSLTELQAEKEGKATLDDITQEWANIALEGYTPEVTSDASISGKKIVMKKNNVIIKYAIYEQFNMVELPVNTSNVEFLYDLQERVDNKVNILIHIQDKENGLSSIKLPDQDIITVSENKKGEQKISYQVEIGKEYIVTITSENGVTTEEKILIEDYWHSITKTLGEGLKIDNTAIKAAYNKEYQATLTTQGNYAITSLTVTMGGQEVTSQGNNIVDLTTGKIYIEKVTGDIEITVKSKELRIQYTTIAISKSSSPNNTESETNKVEKGTPLYINIIANLEGTSCKVTLRSDSKESVPYKILKNGKYEFWVEGTYNGKTIGESKEVTVDQYQSAQELVKYDAGNWTAEEIQQLTEQKLYYINSEHTVSSVFKLNNDDGYNFTFGGFTYEGDLSNSSAISSGKVIVSRNQSVEPQSGKGTPNYDGWQILESEERDNKRYVTKIVHAGSPENFVYVGFNPHRAEYLLSSGTRKIDSNTLATGETINVRKWDMYKDKKQLNLIDNVHLMTYEESANIDVNIRKTGACYWLASARDNNNLHGVSTGGNYYYSNGYAWGIRPVVSLKSGVYIKEGDGTEASPFVLAIDN